RPDPLPPRSHPNPRPRGARRHCLRMLRRRRAQRRQGICGPATPTIGLSSTFAHPADGACPGRRGDRMRRRAFITLIAGAAAAWPLAARAQHSEKLPAIGFLGSTTPSAESQRTAAFVQRLRELGWIEGRTIAIEYRWGEGRPERFAEIAAEFVRLKVDI